MNFLKNRYSQILCLIIGALSGFFFYHIRAVQFEDKISWISFATFLLTIVLALYLEFRVRPSISNDRVEKDLVIDQLKVVREAASAVHDYYTTLKSQIPVDPASKTELVRKMRNISNEIDLLKQTVEHCQTTKKSTMPKSIFGAFIQYKRAVTGFKFDEASFSYNSEFWSKTDSKYKNLRMIVQHAIIDINRI